MKSVVALSLLAGAACALPAMAQVDTLVPAGQAMHVPARCLSLPTREFSPRDVQSVYEVTNPDGGVFTNTALPKQLLDDCSLVPGPASNGTFPMLVTGMFVSFAVADPVVDFDVEVTFWDGATDELHELTVVLEKTSDVASSSCGEAPKPILRHRLESYRQVHGATRDFDRDDF